MWHIGQKVIYVGEDKNYPKGIREIQGISETPCCGQIIIDTGAILLDGFEKDIMECLCSELFKSHGIFWQHERKFRPVDFAEDVISAIKEQIKEEIILN